MAAPRVALSLCLAATLFVRAEPKTKVIPAFAGPYILYMDKVYPCPNAPSDIRWTVRHTHFNPSKPFEKQALSGFVNISRAPFDDSWWGLADVAVRSSNQWKEHAFIFKFPGLCCSAFRANVPDAFRVVFQQRIGDGLLDKQKKCVVPPSCSVFDHEPVDWVFPNLPIFPYGHYRVNLTGGASDNARVGFCLLAEYHVIPKPR